MLLLDILRQNTSAEQQKRKPVATKPRSIAKHHASDATVTSASATPAAVGSSYVADDALGLVPFEAYLSAMRMCSYHCNAGLAVEVGIHRNLYVYICTYICVYMYIYM
jgi:hypothetical protein